MRADTAVRPYAEDLFQEEASPKPKREVVGICVTSGDLGTHGMHPLRERGTHCVDTPLTHEDHYRDVHGQAPLPARTRQLELRRVTATAQRDTRERSATGEQQRDGARLRCDVGAWV